MDISGPRRAGEAFSHYDTVNLDKVSLLLSATGLDGVDGTFSVHKSNTKDADGFTPMQDSTPADITKVMAADGFEEIVIDPFPYKYIRIDWTPNTVTAGEVQVKVHKPKTRGMY